jgi:coenzyme F420-reducing hydrogenase beta subunit
MVYDEEEGRYAPTVTAATCEVGCGLCDRVCAFASAEPSPLALNEALFAAGGGAQHDPVAGYYRGVYSGYSESHRLTSASGGVLTWVAEQLLARKEVSAALCVTQDPESPTRFRFTRCATVAELRACGGSCYTSVNMAEALRAAMSEERPVAVVAVPCFATALRRAQKSLPRFQRNIRYILGLVCGGIRTYHWVRYVSATVMKAGNPDRVRFRAKWEDAAAQPRFRFEYRSPDGGWEERQAVFSDRVKHIFGSRLFAMSCCNQCDDTLAVTADATFCDAWLPEYSRDWRGHSLLVVRNAALQEMIASAKPPELNVEAIPLSVVQRSTRGRVREWRTRLWMRKDGGRSFPEAVRTPAPRWIERLTARLQDVIRVTGLAVWRRTRSYRAVRPAVSVSILALRAAWFLQNRLPDRRAGR